MAKVKIPIPGTIGKSIRLNPDATPGAQVGLNLLDPSGKLVNWSDILNPPDSATPPSTGDTFPLLADSTNVTLTYDATATVITGDLTNVTVTSGGSLKKYGFDAKGRLSQQANATTTDLAEGTNLYFTNPRVGAALAPGSGITLSTDPISGITTIGEAGTVFNNLTDQALVLMTDQTGVQLTDNSAGVPQAANSFNAGPSSGSPASPTFRAIVAADIAGALPTDIINGLKLIWNSATSISLGSGYASIPSTGVLESVPSTLTLSGLSLTASTWYHVYLYDVAGTPTIECVTTAPDVPYRGTARAKTGDTTRRYLGSILTNASSQVISFAHSPQQGRIDYRSGIGSAPFMILANGRATSAANVSCSGVVPVTAIQALCFTFNDPTTTVTVLTSASDGAVVPGAFEGFVAAGAQVSSIQRLDSSQAFSYAYQSAPAGTFGFTVRVNGYIFER